MPISLKTLSEEELHLRNVAARDSAVRLVKRGLAFIRENWGLLTTAGFALAAAIQQVIFNAWGLNYLQIASPTDVLMGGVDFMLRVGISGSGFIIGAVTPYFILRHRTFIFIIILLLLFGLFHLVRHVIGHGDIEVLIISGSFIVGWIFGHPDHQNDDSCRHIKDPIERRERHEREVAETLVMLGLLTVLGAASLSFIAIVNSGFGAGETRLLDNKLGNCNGEVLWVGSEKVVFKCDATSEVRVRAAGDELELQVNRPHPTALPAQKAKPANPPRSDQHASQAAPVRVPPSGHTSPASAPEDHP